MTTLTALGLLAGASACGSDDDVPSAAPAATSPVPSGSTQAPSQAPSPSAAAPSSTGSAPPPAGGAPANVSFDDQSGAGDTVQVVRVSMPTAGFVVVTADGDDDRDDDGDDRIVGSAPVPAGATDAVTVTLAPPLTQDTDLEAVLYADTDGNGAFDANADRRIPDTDADTVSEDAGYDVR